MLWYEPYSSPADWAEHNATNIEALMSHWQYCRFNHAVVNKFIQYSEFNFEKFASLIHLYKISNATDAQFDDLMSMLLYKLKEWIEGHISWKYNKDIHDEKNAASNVHITLLMLGFLYNSEATQIALYHYNDADDELKYALNVALMALYYKWASTYNPGDSAFVDFDYAENCLYEITKRFNMLDSRYSTSSVLPTNEESNYNRVLRQLILEYDPERYKDMKSKMIEAIIFDYANSHTCKLLEKLYPEVSSTFVDDINRSLYSMDKSYSDASPLFICSLVNSKYPRECIAKIAKICINNMNHFYGNVISESCIESIMTGIESQDRIEVSHDKDIDLDKELTSLEYITITSSATEANSKYDDYEEEPDEEYEEAPKKQKEEPKPDPNEKKSINQRVRDFDADYRKFKANAKQVDRSLSKIIGEAGRIITGRSESRGIRKATGDDTIAKILARVFGTIAVFHVSKFLGLLFVVVRLANSRSTTMRERNKILTEIETEIEVIDTQINDGSVEDPNARHALLKIKRNLKDAAFKIRQGRPNEMTDDSKKAVRDIVDRRGN